MPAAGSTARVGASPIGGLKSRVGRFLVLEGDESGYLLLEGDAQESGFDRIKLEGDILAITANHTKRVTGT